MSTTSQPSLTKRLVFCDPAEGWSTSGSTPPSRLFIDRGKEAEERELRIRPGYGDERVRRDVTGQIRLYAAKLGRRVLMRVGE
jgi:hypothetical protein